MPRIFGGHTNLGQKLNEQEQKTGHSLTGKVNFKYAVIHKSFNSTYIFTMRLLDNNEITRPIPIIGSPDELAMRFGSPSEMEGIWEVLISYKGNSVNRGSAQIIGKYGTSINQMKEETEQSNQLLVKGTAFAPPGPGV